MQQAKEQVNYRGTKTPPKSEQNGTQDLSNRQRKTGTCQYCAGPLHPRFECPASNKQCSEKGCERIKHFAHAPLQPEEHPSESEDTEPQAHHLDASLGEENETDLFEVDIKPGKWFTQLQPWSKQFQEYPNLQTQLMFSVLGYAVFPCKVLN